ncbi:Lethal(2) giant larvae [Podosphaera aphanis]|nr:Lethal(2) giant larvae [Podosphaera aphanis]
MAGFLRGKQAGIQNDLSAGIIPELFAPDDLARFGINSQIGCLAYDAVQSLLAIGTMESSLGSGQIYIFGQKRVQVTLQLPRSASIRHLKFCAESLISLDSKSELIIWNLTTRKKRASIILPGVVTLMVTDPMLDWALIGLQSGKMVAYDLDRESLAPLRLPNFWQEKTKKAIPSPIVSMQWHPRDIGQLLIGYPEGAVLYSFKQAKPIQYLEYTVPVGAPGGTGDPAQIAKTRKPSLTHVFWHPTGIFIGTAYDDSSLVFWDHKDYRIIMARTLSQTCINDPQTQVSEPFSEREPFRKILWCCKENPDDTGILTVGGSIKSNPEKGLSFLELGVTPIYATSTWQSLTDYFNGTRQSVLSTPIGIDILDFCLIPRTSPHYAGAQDPIAVIALLSSGELVTLSFPGGHPISPTNQLHPSITFVHPFINSTRLSLVDRTRWLGMSEKRQQGPLLLKGGIEASKPFKRFVSRNILLMSHADGTLRVWDAGEADQLENSAMLQIDVARALERLEEIYITDFSMAASTGELVVGTSKGEVVIYRWGVNKYYGRTSPERIQPAAGELTDISSRSEPTLKEGLQPFVLYNCARGSITVVKVSDVGFVAIGTESGGFSIIDLRGPSIIFSSKLSELVSPVKRKGFLKTKGTTSPSLSDWPVVIEFGVLSLEGDNYSSITCFVGTQLGLVLTFKILPGINGIYTVQLAGTSSLTDKIISITPIIADTGKRAKATGEIVGELRTGEQTHGILVAVSQTEVRIFKPAIAKGARKTFDDYFCDSARVATFEGRGCALIGIFGDAKIRAFSIPGLKEISSARIPMLEPSRFSSSIITDSGGVFGWSSPSELAFLNVWGTGQLLQPSSDTLFNPEALIPPRPTISSLQWITGTQYLSPIDLDLLIGGPDRRPSKRMLTATAEEDRLARSNGNQSRVNETQSSEGWGDYMVRQLNERTEKLDLVGNSMNKMQENSQGWADDVSKFVKKQKKNMVLGAISGKWL